MKRNARSIVAGALALAVLAIHAHGAPTIQVVLDTTNVFLVANNLQRAKISLTGFNDGESIQGLIGTRAHPWRVTTTNTTGFFNVQPPPAPPVPTIWATNYADSGLLPSDQNSPFGIPMGGIGGFGSVSNGQPEILPNGFWLNANPAGFAVNSTSVLDVLQITWPRNRSTTVGFVVVMNTPPVQIPLIVVMPALGSCPWDLNEDEVVNITDLLDLIAQWGTNGPADLNNDGTVNVADLLTLISQWGGC